MNRCFVLSTQRVIKFDENEGYHTSVGYLRGKELFNSWDDSHHWRGVNGIIHNQLLCVTPDEAPLLEDLFYQPKMKNTLLKDRKIKIKEDFFVFSAETDECLGTILEFGNVIKLDDHYYLAITHSAGTDYFVYSGSVRLKSDTYETRVKDFKDRKAFEEFKKNRR